jgi:hypothetical protein
MANSVYKSATVKTIDDRSLYITPLKIFYLRRFMEKFGELAGISEEDEKISILIDCTAIAMEQYCPELSSIEEVEDSFDINTMYKIIQIAGGISFNEEDSKEREDDGKGSSWEDLDLVGLESKAFLLGIWKDYHELETSISMPELIAILEAKNEADSTDKKFLAAIQGVDLDEGKPRQDEWTKLKDKVFGAQKESDPKDVTSLTGAKAAEAGFGIGMGLDYERMS